MNHVAHPLTALALICLAASPLAALGPHERLERFEATFVLEAAGMKVGRTRWSLAPGTAGSHVATSYTEPVGVFALIRDETRTERSEWTWEGDRLKPIEYRYQRTGRKSREIGIAFDWEANVAHHESPDASWRLPVPPGTMDKFSYVLAMMRDFGRGKRRVEYTIANGGRRLKRYVLTGVGEERIETGIGTFDTTVIRRVDGNGKPKTTMWCVADLGFLPVKIVHVEGDGEPVTLIIESLSGIEGGGS